MAELRTFRTRFPAIPLIAWGAFRPDDGELLASWQREGVALVLVDGVDDWVAGDLVRRASLTALRRELLADGPRVLRLTHPLQHQTWELLLDRADHPARTAELAAALSVSREHLSRQFGAGGAPNLKRVIDLIRVAGAAQLLANPGLDLARRRPDPRFCLSEPPRAHHSPDHRAASPRPRRARRAWGAGGVYPGQDAQSAGVESGLLEGRDCDNFHKLYLNRTS